MHDRHGYNIKDIMLSFMAVADVPWAVKELQRFIHLVDLAPLPLAAQTSSRERMEARALTEDQIIAQAPVVESILDQTLPSWRRTILPSRTRSPRWSQLREAAQRSITVLQRQTELREKLGDNAPTIAANRLHPWAWDGARSLWGSHHYREAVEAALKKVTAEAQNKTGRHDVSETDLFQQLFSLDQPKPGKPRLRLMADDGSKTYENVHRGARSLAEGLFAGIRNVVAHTVAETEVDEQRALEQLAAVSVLARWVDDAQVVTFP